MTKQPNSKQNTPPSTSDNDAERTTSSNKPVEGDDEHTYDPVGMAGKKAGKVEEIEAQARQAGNTSLKDRTTKGKG